MKKIFSLILFITIFGLSISIAQEQWNYVGKMTFPSSDTSFVRPFLCHVDMNGNLWVTSSRSTDTSAHNVIYKLPAGKTTFEKFIDFTAIKHRLVGSIKGITSVGNDIFITADIPYALYAPNTLGLIMRFRNGDPQKRETFANSMVSGDANNADLNVQSGGGTGTTIFCIAATKDTFLYSGIGYLNSIRVFNYNSSITSPAYGSWVGWTDYQNTPTEPGGLAPTGADVIRDISLIPGRNYDDSTSKGAVFYTSRNSLPTNSTGGVAVWAGGKKMNPKIYAGQRVTDAAGMLAFGSYVPYGITVDNSEQLWVAGPDSIRRWVKFFQVAGNFAMEAGELPSKNSMTNPVSNGAPFITPNDVALTNDNKTAYVIDAVGRCAWKFTYGVSDVKENTSKPAKFELSQNYPNPFNPSTIITFEIPYSSKVVLKVYNMLGEEISTLVNETKAAGKHTVVFNSKNLPTGIYYYKAFFGNSCISKKMMLVK
jgi:hypothetical protein